MLRVLLQRPAYQAKAARSVLPFGDMPPGVEAQRARCPESERFRITGWLRCFEVCLVAIELL
jgi:hypothetical protein